VTDGRTESLWQYGAPHFCAVDARQTPISLINPVHILVLVQPPSWYYCHHYRHETELLEGPRDAGRELENPAQFI